MLGISCFFFFNDTATTEIYTLSLHDALPIFGQAGLELLTSGDPPALASQSAGITGVSHCARPDAIFSQLILDRKSTRLNSSHLVISYAVFCLKKKNIRASPTFSSPTSCLMLH